MRKEKVIRDGQEVEIEVPEVTELISNDELFNEALKMRGLDPDSLNKKKQNSKVDAELSLMKEQLQLAVNKIQDLTKSEEEHKKIINETVVKLQADKISATLDEAIKTGRITPEQKEAWNKRLNDHFDEFSKVLMELPGNKALAKNEQKQEQKQSSNLITDPIRERFLATANITN